MLGDKISVFRGVFLNPLVWMGLVLTGMTLSHEQDVFGIFFIPKTYGLLAMGAAIYVALFGIHYTEGREHVNWSETMAQVLYTMGVILVSWVFSLSIIMSYRTSGESLRARMVQKLSERAEQSAANGGYSAGNYNDDSYGSEGYSNEPINVEEIISKYNLDRTKSYIITPNPDGSIAVEMISE